ncbi:hypothetical protein DFS34DRAFT_239716 [Phlyctochytrium arcticum]|nr:hypothetical protein DFS34DRAFT_239716 [Phlyctochytrium arcticum]
MLLELTAASTFLASHLPPTTPPATRSVFQATLHAQMQSKFHQHWDSTQPLKGNGYRAVSIMGGRLDPLVLDAAAAASLDEQQVASSFPEEFVLWVDPGSVCYKVGDRNFAVTVWESKAPGTPSSDFTPRGRSSPVTIKAPPKGPSPTMQNPQPVLDTRGAGYPFPILVS